MDRLKKLLWMILIFWIVFFIICDEKWYKIWFENNQIVFNEIEKKTYSVEVKFDPNAVYKNSDLIHLNYEFENKNVLRKSDGMDPKYVAKLEQEKKYIRDLVLLLWVEMILFLVCSNEQTIRLRQE